MMRHRFAIQDNDYEATLLHHVQNETWHPTEISTDFLSRSLPGPAPLFVYFPIHLRPQVEKSLDSLQFAYCPQVRLDEAIIYLLL